MGDESIATTLTEQGRLLILAAFDAARRSGRADWRRMTLAVLKNRILSQTSRKFDERAWGAPSFRGFVEQYPTIVAIDHTSRPLVAELLADSADATALPDDFAVPSAETTPSFVRNDLWKAVLDYSSGATYVWRQGIATPVRSNDESAGYDLKLPTASQAEMAVWRTEFVELARAATTDASLLSLLDDWLTESKTAAALPHPFRRQWLDFLKRHVVERLVTWFGAHDLAAPTELTAPAIRRTRELDETEHIRDLIIRCVRVMSRAEMESLRLPPSAVLRMRR